MKKGIKFLCLLLLLCSAVQAKEIILEAENATLLNGATVANSSLCSGGRKVGNIGNPTRNGGIKLNFNLDKAGVYIINIYYLNAYTTSADARNLYITVNGGTSTLVNCPSTGGWDKAKVMKVMAPLLQGSNTITLDNPVYYGADIDMVIIEEPFIPDTNPANIIKYNLDKWALEVNTKTGVTDIIYNGYKIISQNQARFLNAGVPVYLQDMKDVIIQQTNITDNVGTGKRIDIKAVTQDNKINITHSYYLYEGKDYLLTDFTLSSADVIISNYLSPVNTTTASTLFSGGTNKGIWVPYDNDKWIRYQLLDFGISLTGYEVGAFINQENRQGLVVGSVEHNLWKTGVRAITAGNELSRLEVYGGASAYETRDVLQHGSVRSTTIKSPKVMIGWFSDWRRGMEQYGDVNALIAPKLYWAKGKPFLWNSWGAIQTKLSYTNASEVSQYFANTLMPKGFMNDSTVYIDLDSYWDNIAYADMFKLAREIKARKQQPGIYWTPFVDWSKNPNRLVEGSDNVYYKDVYLYANGAPQEIASAWAIDPTHPAVKKRMDIFINRFLSQGFTFLKLDFMCHGALEADSYYDKTVFTGMQAYNQGMEYIKNLINGRMYLNLSIAPLFPAQYAHSRRIACDAYGSINDSEYTLNSLTYGWWLDHAYTYNDADNIVLNNFTDGENRARVTSSVITGIYCSGDDFSSAGSSSAKTKAETFLLNTEVNQIARTAKAFAPVETGDGSKAANMFSQIVADTLYLAVFNYSALTSLNQTINIDRIGLSGGNRYTVKELWSGVETEKSTSWSVTVPRKDAVLYKIYLKKTNSLPKADSKKVFFSPNPFIDEIHLQNIADYNKIYVSVFNAEGRRIMQKEVVKSLDFRGHPSGLYMIQLSLENGEQYIQKVLKK